MAAYKDDNSTTSDEDILEQAKGRWELCVEHWSEQYETSKDDWAFLHGENQWDNRARSSREKEAYWRRLQYAGRTRKMK